MKQSLKWINVVSLMLISQCRPYCIPNVTCSLMLVPPGGKDYNTLI